MKYQALFSLKEKGKEIKVSSAAIWLGSALWELFMMPLQQYAMNTS